MSRLRPGLCSISFRGLAPDDVLRLAERAGLAAIEWGSDVHAPPGDLGSLRDLARRCAEAGIACPSYGSYFFAGRSDPGDLDPLLDAAAALGATTVRAWAAMGVGPDAPPEAREPVVVALRAAAKAAAARDLRLGLEFHPGTLTHTAASALALLDGVGAAELYSYWQPEAGADPAHSLAELEAVLPHLAHVHVFSWDPDPAHRRPLAHLEAMWRPALQRARRAPTSFEPRCAYLEYLPDDDPEALLRDAACLARWLGEEET